MELERKNYYLPDEILLKIFSNIETSELCKLEVVCKRWQELVYDASLWKSRVSSIFNKDLTFKETKKYLEYAKICFPILFGANKIGKNPRCTQLVNLDQKLVNIQIKMTTGYHINKGLETAVLFNYSKKEIESLFHFGAKINPDTAIRLNPSPKDPELLPLILKNSSNFPHPQDQINTLKNSLLLAITLDTPLRDFRVLIEEYRLQASSDTDFMTFLETLNISISKKKNGNEEIKKLIAQMLKPPEEEMIPEKTPTRRFKLKNLARKVKNKIKKGD